MVRPAAETELPSPEHELSPERPSLTGASALKSEGRRSDRALAITNPQVTAMTRGVSLSSGPEDELILANTGVARIGHHGTTSLVLEGVWCKTPVLP